MIPSASTSSCILRIALPVPLYQLFDYQWHGDPSQLSPGIRIKVPFGKRTMIGFLVAITDTPEHYGYAIKDIIAIVDHTPLIDKKLQKLLEWMANYYHYPYGQVINNALPTLLCKGAVTLEQLAPIPVTPATSTQAPLALNKEQENAVELFTASLHRFQAFLLQGVTGSGKTEVYLQTIQHVLALNKQVLVLVPEIGLTPQTIARFSARFSAPILTFHSKMTDKERMHVWLQAKNNAVKIIIGTRSAVFLPMPSLGLIIIDEEHDLSYKQQDRCRYHARDVAIMRSHQHQIPIILGSATPSLETLDNVKKEKYSKCILTKMAIALEKTSIDIIDIRNKPLRGGLSTELITTLEQHLERGEQGLLFLNRRGYSPLLLCQLCGYIEKCPRCDVAMTLHLSPKYLCCHHCGSQRKFQEHCPHCKQPTLQLIGLGTERIEEALSAIFPQYTLVRVDRDNMQGKHAFDTLTREIADGKYQILLGTQMLAKGHHFPNLTFIGIIDMDNAFFSSDFRAMEHMGQLITQVSGRAGRENKPGKVLLQTYQPDNPRLQLLLKKGYNAFANELLLERKQLQLPPITYAAILRAQARSMTQALQFLEEIKKSIPTSVTVLGPIPASHAKRAGYFRAHCFIQSPCRKTLQQALTNLPVKISQIKNANRFRWHLDIDPVESI